MQNSSSSKRTENQLADSNARVAVVVRLFSGVALGAAGSQLLEPHK